jgi:hypothetical protein
MAMAAQLVWDEEQQTAKPDLRVAAACSGRSTQSSSTGWRSMTSRT